MLASVASPMPSTSSSSSTAVKPPCSVAPGQDRLRRSPGPTSGSVSSSAWSAVLRLTSGAPRRRGRRPAAAARPRPAARRDPDHDLLAVDEHPGQVEVAQVDAGPRAPGRLERVDHPRPGVEHGDARAAHLAGDVDRDRPSPTGRRRPGRGGSSAGAGTGLRPGPPALPASARTTSQRLDRASPRRGHHRPPRPRAREWRRRPGRAARGTAPASRAGPRERAAPGRAPGPAPGRREEARSAGAAAARPTRVCVGRACRYGARSPTRAAEPSRQQRLGRRGRRRRPGAAWLGRRLPHAGDARNAQPPCEGAPRSAPVERPSRSTRPRVRHRDVSGGATQTASMPGPDVRAEHGARPRRTRPRARRGCRRAARPAARRAAPARSGLARCATHDVDLPVPRGLDRELLEPRQRPAGVRTFSSVATLPSSISAAASPPARRRTAPRRRRSGRRGAGTPACRRRTATSRRGAAPAGGLGRLLGADPPRVEHVGGRQRGEPGRHPDLPAVDGVHRHRGVPRRQLRGLEGAAHLAGQVDRDDLRRRPPAAAARRPRAARRRRPRGADRPELPQRLRHLVRGGAARTPRRTTSAPMTTWSGTTTIPRSAATSRGRLAVESVTTGDRHGRRHGSEAAEPGAQTTTLTSFGRAHDHLAHLASVDRSHDVRRRPAPAPPGRPRRCPATTSSRASHLALDLDDGGDRLLDQQRLVDGRPAGPGDGRLVAQPLPHLLGGVRRHQRQQDRHRLGGLAHGRVPGTARRSRSPCGWRSPAPSRGPPSR